MARQPNCRPSKPIQVGHLRPRGLPSRTQNKLVIRGNRAPLLLTQENLQNDHVIGLQVSRHLKALQSPQRHDAPLGPSLLGPSPLGPSPRADAPPTQNPHTYLTYRSWITRRWALRLKFLSHTDPYDRNLEYRTTCQALNPPTPRLLQFTDGTIAAEDGNDAFHGNVQGHPRRMGTPQ